MCIKTQMTLFTFIVYINPTYSQRVYVKILIQTCREKVMGNMNRQEMWFSLAEPCAHIHSHAFLHPLSPGRRLMWMSHWTLLKINPLYEWHSTGWMENISPVEQRQLLALFQTLMKNRSMKKKLREKVTHNSTLGLRLEVQFNCSEA